MTGIIIIFYNNAELLLRQYAAIKASCTEAYRLVVVDNSSDVQAAKDMQYHAGRLGLEYLKTNAASSNGSESHAFAANLAWQRYRDRFETIVFLDHDCFPIKPWSAGAILGTNYLMAGLGQQNGRYYWPGCLMVRSTVDLDFSPMPGMDTGGGTYKAIEENEGQAFFFNEAYCENPYFSNSQYNFYALINDGMFMHFINGSNWNNAAENQERLNSLYNILENYFKP